MAITKINPYSEKLQNAYRCENEADIEKYLGLWKAYNEELIDDINIKKDILEGKLTEVKKIRGIRSQYVALCSLYSEVASFLVDVRRVKEGVRTIRYKKRYLEENENGENEEKRTEVEVVGKENLQEVMDCVESSKDLRRFVEVSKDK